MTKDEIVSYFRRYSNNVTTPEFFNRHGFTKSEIFQYCLDRLYVEDQYRALVELCVSPPQIKFAKTLPQSEQRDELLGSLHAVGAVSGLAVRAVEGLPNFELRREWLKATSRLEKNPSAAVTSARTLLEAVCKAILRTDDSPDKPEADLGKLVRAVRRRLRLVDDGPDMTPGVATLVNGLAQLSNAAGDRHGAPGSDQVLIANARLACDSAFMLSLHFLDVARVSPIPSRSHLDPD